jgi:tungstate transport system ATP-binding protein
MAPPNPQTILETHDLTVHRNGTKILHIHHLEVQEGEILALIGPNGAGKSTLLLALTHLLKPSSGGIFYRGNLVSNKDDLAYRRKIALVLQDP